MAKRKNEPYGYEAMTPYVRGFIIYLWLLSIFGSVILIVHAGMEEKRIRYELTDKIQHKRELMEEVRKLENKVAGMERYSRISSLLDESLPHLGPPRHPAIEIAVPGLEESSSKYDSPLGSWERETWIDQARNWWENTQQSVQTTVNGWLN